MDINVGEMSIGDILGRGMKLLFKRLPYFYAIQLIVVVPTLAFQLASHLLPLGPGAILPVLFLTIVLAPFASAAMLRVIVQEYLDGQVSLAEAFQFALGRFLPLLGTSILMGILLWVGFLLCCIPGIYFAVVWSMVSQVVVVERLSGMEALNRSKSLTAGYFGHVFGLVLLLGLINMGVALGLSMALGMALPFQELPQLGPQGQPNPFAAPVITNYANFAIVTVVPALVNIVVGAYGAICVTFLYFDLRNRKEGYDLSVEFAKIAAWRERAWDDDADLGMPPGSAAPPTTGIKEPGTVLPPPDTGIKEPGTPMPPPDTGVKGPPPP
jgi:hypothetical protein